MAILDRAEKMVKFPFGPISDRPGPMLEMQESAAVKLVVKSCPSKETTRVQPSRIMMNSVKKV